MTKTKFVDLEKLLNFVVDNFLFSIYYGPKYLFQNKMNIYSSIWNIATTLLFTFKLNAKYQETIFLLIFVLLIKIKSNIIGHIKLMWLVI